jgi:hypothetical protein
MRHASVGKRGFSFFARCFLLLLAITPCSGHAAAGSAAAGNIRFTFERAETKRQEGAAIISGREIQYSHRYIKVVSSLVNDNEDRDILEIRDRTVRVFCDVVHITSGKVVGKKVLSRELDDLLGIRLTFEGSLQIITGVGYPEDINKLENFELRATGAELEAKYVLSPPVMPAPPRGQSGPPPWPAHPVKLVPSGSVWGCRVNKNPLFLIQTITRERLENNFTWEDAGRLPAPFGNIARDGESAALVARLPASAWGKKTLLRLKTIFTIPGRNAFSALQLNATADNGFLAFLNGTEIAREYGYGFKSRDSGVIWEGNATWEYSLSVPPVLLVPGENTLEVYAFDGGGDSGDETFFDMELTARKK